MTSLSTVDTFKSIKHRDDMVVVEGQMLIELQLTLLDMLSDIDDICVRDGIDYQLGGGSCLGAVRHGGFIPWDDDLDINMTRSAFNKLARHLTERYPDKYWIHDASTPGYCWGGGRVRRKGTVVRGKGELDLEECGAWIDICFIENAPDMPLLRLVHGVGSLALGLALSCRNFANHEAEYLSLVSSDPDALKVFTTKVAIGKALSFMPAEAWAKAWDKWNSLCKNERSKYVTIPVGRKHYFGDMYERVTLFPSLRTKFEKINSFIPNKFGDYLTHMYGDYTQIPPEDKREVHVVYELQLRAEQSGKSK